METKLVYKIISYFSFAFFIVTGLAAYGQTHNFSIYNYDDGYTIFWDIFSTREVFSKKTSYYPVENMNSFLYILFSILLLLAINSLIMIIIYRNISAVDEGMFGTYSRFHFIPLLCGACLYIIGETFSTKNLINDFDAPFICSIIFSIIGLVSLIFIYFKSDFESHTYTRIIIKKGFYSCLITLFVYNLCFTISLYGLLKPALEKNSIDNILDRFKGYSIAFSILIGVINLVLGFLLKDIGIAIMNILIYLGLIINFFKLDKAALGQLNGYAEGIIDIIIEVLTVVEIIFLAIRYKTSISGEEQKLI